MSHAIELNHLETDRLNGGEEEKVGKDVVATSLTEDRLEPITMDTTFYSRIFAIMLPYIFVGAPFNFCFDKPFARVQKCVSCQVMKIYTFAISIFAHTLLVYWIYRLVYYLLIHRHINKTFLEDAFILLLIVAGIVGLDLVWVNRNSIRKVLNQLDWDPLGDSGKNRTLLTTNACELRWDRFKFYILATLSYLLAILPLFYYGYLVYFVVKALNNLDQHPEWHDHALRIISVYALYFFVSDAALLVSLIWAIKSKIKHLNLFIKNLTKIEEHPEVKDIELIKSWYQNIIKITKRIDESFALYIIVFIGYLFVAIIYFVSRTIDVLKIGHVESSEFAWNIGAAGVHVLALFYGLKELTDVHDLSLSTKSLLFDYVLETKPEERSTAFFEEINFVSTGLLNTPATFTLLGQIELNKEFLVKIGLVIYSYTILFHQFTQNIDPSVARGQVDPKVSPEEVILPVNGTASP